MGDQWFFLALVPTPTVTGDDTAAAVEAIHEHLVATEELPVDVAASRWIGEAQAVTGDLVDAGADETVHRERLGHVRDLLEHVEETGHPDADEHVARALGLTREALERFEE